MDIARDICTDSFYIVNSGLPCIPVTAVMCDLGKFRYFDLSTFCKFCCILKHLILLNFGHVCAHVLKEWERKKARKSVSPRRRHRGTTFFRLSWLPSGRHQLRLQTDQDSPESSQSFLYWGFAEENFWTFELFCIACPYCSFKVLFHSLCCKQQIKKYALIVDTFLLQWQMCQQCQSAWKIGIAIYYISYIAIL